MAWDDEDLAVREAGPARARQENKKQRDESGEDYSRAWAFACRYWKRQPHLAAGVFVASTLAVVADVISPWMAGRIIDAVAESKGLEAALWALAAFSATGLGFVAAKQVTDQLWIRLQSRAMEEIVNEAFGRVQRFSADWHANSFAGAVVRKITRGKWGFDLYCDTLLWGFWPASLILIGTTGVMLANWWEVGAFVGVMALLYVAVSIGLSVGFIGPANRRSVMQDSKISGLLADALGCVAVIKNFGAEAREDRRIAKAENLWRMRVLRAWGRGVGTNGLQGVMIFFMYGGAIAIALTLWDAGRMSAGDVVVVLSAVSLINAYLRFIGEHAQNLQKSVNDMEDVMVFLDPVQDPEGVTAVRDRAGALRLQAAANANQAGNSRLAGEIRFEDVTFRYPAQSEALYSNFSLTIAPGERVGLVGPSGSGKSTFVKLLQRLYDLNGGRIMIDGQDIAAVQQSSLRQAIAMVPQDPVLFHRSLAENIAYGRPGAPFAEIVVAARQAQAHDFIANLPKGYETLVGERGVKLSGGERQRVAIARALLADAPILVLDEATASLDSLAEALIQKALERLMAGRTTIVVAHRLATVQRMDRILVFDQGRIVEQGTHGELVAREGGHYRQLFEEQALGLLDGWDPASALTATPSTAAE